MDIVISGRHCEVTERFRRYVTSKLAKLERIDHQIIRIDVEICKEHNPRLAHYRERVELTAISRGPVVRAEAAAEERHAALDLALDKLQARLRKMADRRRVHHGARTPVSVAQATSPNGPAPSSLVAAVAGAAPSPDHPAPVGETTALLDVEGDGPLVVREKLHKAEPMTLDQALYEMELVGHDFYLFIDAHTRWPSVVYRRRGYDYGVIRLAD